MKTKKKQINQNKIKIIILLLIITFILSLTAVSILFQKRKEEIKLENNFPTFEVEIIGGNNQNKYLIPIEIPNLNKEKYDHLINIEHKATLKSHNMEIKEILFLKIQISLDTQNTFYNPEKYFDFQIITTNADKKNKIYSNEERPYYIPMKENETQSIIINTQIQQKEILSSNNPILYLVYDYEIVDQQGKTITGGSNIVSNKISNIVNK